MHRRSGTARELPLLRTEEQWRVPSDPERYIDAGDEHLAKAVAADKDADSGAAKYECTAAEKLYTAAVDLAAAKRDNPLTLVEAATKATALHLALANLPNHHAGLSAEEDRAAHEAEVQEAIEDAEETLTLAERVLLSEGGATLAEAAPLVVLEAELAAVRGDEEKLLQLEGVPIPAVAHLVERLKEDTDEFPLAEVGEALLHPDTDEHPVHAEAA